MNNQKTIVKDNAYWEKLYSKKENHVPLQTERNFKFIKDQMVGQEGTHYTCYTEYGKFYTGYRMSMSHTFWTIIEHDSEGEAIAFFHSVVSSILGE